MSTIPANSMPQPPKPKKAKHVYNEFLYRVVNKLTFHEFKKYTNIQDVMQNVLMRADPARDRPKQERVEYYIKQNFRQNIPIEKSWKRGGFVSLKLTNDFYESEVAERVFQEVFGIKKCEVNVVKIVFEAPEDETEVEQIDLTETASNECIYPPKRKVKYPIKLIDNRLAEPSRIVISDGETREENIENSKAEDAHNDEITILSNEADQISGLSNKSADHTYVVANFPTSTNAVAKKGPAIIISDITLTPRLKIQLQNESVQITSTSRTKSDQRISSENVPTIVSKNLSPQSPTPQTKPSETSLPNQNVLASKQIIDPIDLASTTLARPSETSLTNEINVRASKQLLNRKLSQNSTIVPEGGLRSTSPLSSIKQAFEAQIVFIREHFQKYLTATCPSRLSLKRFWHQFLELEYPKDDNWADTQLTAVDIVNSHSVKNNEISQNRLLIVPNLVECQINANANATVTHNARNDSVKICDVEIKVEKPDDSCSSDEDLTILPNLHASVTLNSPKNLSGTGDIEIKLEKLFENSNESYSNDVEIIDVPNLPIEIMDCSTQDLINNLELDRNDSEDVAHYVTPFAIPQQVTQYCSKSGSTAPSSSKGFLTTLPTGPNKKRIYKPLNIVVETVKDIPAVVLPNYDFSQRPDSPIQNYEIEEYTMTDSQIQRYELLNNENSIFVSSQLENYELNTGKQMDYSPPQATTILSIIKQPVAQEQSSTTLCLQSNKRKRILPNIVIHELHWKVLNLKTLILEPLAPNTFNLKIQLRNNFDKFFLNDQQSIKRLLNVSESEWKHVVNILKVINGYVYHVSTPSTLSQKSDLLHRIMNCFIQSIPLFVKSRIHFQDFMGSLIEVTELRPLNKTCANSLIDPSILKQMIQFKKNLKNKID